MATGLILAILNPDWHQQVLTWMDENLHRRWIFHFHRMGFVLRKDPRARRAARRRYVEETIKQSQESILKGYNFSLSIYLWNSPTFQNSSQPLLVTPPCTLMTRCLGLGISQIYNPQDIYNTAPDDLRATAGGSGAAAREEVKVLWKTHDKRLFSLQMKGAHGDGFRRGFGAEPT